MAKKYLSYTKTDHENFIKSLDESMKLRSYLREYIPDFSIPVNESGHILESFEKIADKLIPILSKLHIIPQDIQITSPSKSLKLQKFKAADKELKSDVKIHQPSEIFDIIKDKAILVSSNTVRKKLKTMGIDPRMIKSSSGPLFIEDYKELGHDLPEQALKGIQKKSDKIILDLKELAEANQEIMFIYAVDDITDNINIKRINELEDRIGAKIHLIQVASWDLF